MARTSNRRWKGCQLCKPWKNAAYPDTERIPARELRRMGGRRKRITRRYLGD